MKTKSKIFIITILLSILWINRISDAKNEEVKVKTFIQDVNIGESSVKLPSIVYKDENYIKLRDFSSLLKTIDKDFKIVYNNKTKQISAITAYPYEELGTELKPLEDQPSATVSQVGFDKDNKQLKFNAILIKGHNYFRLRDLAESFEIEIFYDIPERTVYMNPKKNPDTPLVKPGDTLNYKSVETINFLKEEGFTYNISSLNEKKLILTFAKKFNTGGYQLRCERVIYDGNKIIVRPLIISPPLNSMVTQAISYPNCTIEINIEGVKEGFEIEVEGVQSNISMQ